MAQLFWKKIMKSSKNIMREIHLGKYLFLMENQHMDRSLSPLSCILPGLYSNSKNECVSLYFDSKYPNNVNYKNVLPEGIKGYVYKIY